MKFKTNEIKSVTTVTTAFAGTIFPIYELAKLSIGENYFQIRCVNSNIMFENSVGKLPTVTHNYYVNAKLLRGVMQRVTSEELELELEDSSITIKHKNGTYTLPSNSSIGNDNALDRPFDYFDGSHMDLVQVKLAYEIHKHSIPDDKSYLARTVFSNDGKVYSSNGISLTVTNSEVTRDPVNLSVDSLKALISLEEDEARYVVDGTKLAVWGNSFSLLQGDVIGEHCLRTAEETVLQPAKDDMQFICEVGVADFLQASDMIELFVKASIQNEVFITYGEEMVIANKLNKPTAIQRVKFLNESENIATFRHKLNVGALKNALKCIPYETVEIYQAARKYQSVTQLMTFLVQEDITMLIMELPIG